MQTRPFTTIPLGRFPNQAQPRLYDRAVEVLRTAHDARGTEKADLHWIGRLVRFHRGQHPRELREPGVNAFLTHLAVEGDVSSSTHNQALAAFLFLYEHVLQEPLGGLEGVIRAKRPKRLPVVLTREETRKILDELDGVHRLVGLLLYGSGLRLLEALRLRVKDADFGRSELTIRDATGNKDRRTMLPQVAVDGLRHQIEVSRQHHERDLTRGVASVELPHAFARKCPSAAFEFRWKYVFPATGISRDPRSGIHRRHHLHEASVSKAIRAATKQSDITQRVTAPTFRHSFATHLIEPGSAIRTVQELLAHSDVRTTMIGTHVLNRGGQGVRSPAAFDDFRSG